MNNYLPLLQTTTLFAGLSAAELSTLLSRLGGSVRSYGKGEALVLAGSPAAGWASCCPASWRPTARHRAGCASPSPR